ncbi:MAG: polysaccharide deacetylase family protein [bacterium]
MFTFRRFTLLFFMILLGLNLWNVFLGKSPTSLINTHGALLYSMLFLAYFGISFGMAFLPCTNFHHPVICSGTGDEKSVSLTFDDGPDPAKTPLALDVLKKHGVTAAFFCIGNNISGNPDLVQRIYHEGHILGNHSLTHSKWFDLFPATKIRAELLETDRLLKELTGQSPLLFRPPFGVVNPMVSNALKKMHWTAVCWNIRSLDTINRDAEKTRKKILRQLKPGSVILLHDGSDFTEHHLDELISGIRDAGYGIVPLDQLIKMPAYAT